ncbi:MAG: hypothetical protein AAFY60_17740, partial [Myxococcota bacterium]
FRRNLCIENESDRGGCLVFPNSATGNVVQGNSIFDNEAASGLGNNAYVNPDQCFDITLENTFFGVGDPGAQSGCTQPDHNFVLSNNATEAWPLCVDNDEAPDCVGASISP